MALELELMQTIFLARLAEQVQQRAEVQATVRSGRRRLGARFAFDSHFGAALRAMWEERESHSQSSRLRGTSRSRRGKYK